MRPENIKEIKKKRKAEAVWSVVAFALLQSVIAGALGAMCLIPEMPGWGKGLLIVLALLCLALVVPPALMLKGRFHEIEGGELDAASQY